jgi:hypothetical protein
MFWQRDVLVSKAELVRDFEVLLPQVVVDLDALSELRHRLVEWQVNPSEFVCRLGTEKGGDQVLTFAVGRDANLICNVLRPACILTYECGAAMVGRWAFLVDQSCIRLCSDSLGEFLKTLPR